MNVNYYTNYFPLYVKAEPETACTQQTTMPVLIVDDSPLIVKKIKELLDEVERITSVESCGTYAEAVHLLATYHPVIVLLDINLPDKNGIVLLRYIKTSFPEITIIMVTNQSEPFYKNLCLELGARFYLDKSKDFEKLPALITSII